MRRILLMITTGLCYVFTSAQFPGFKSISPEERCCLQDTFDTSTKKPVTIQMRCAATSMGNRVLFVVDGLPMPDSFALRMIDPETISSIDILKPGASSAIYGCCAAQGVVIISTKPHIVIKDKSDGASISAATVSILPNKHLADTLCLTSDKKGMVQFDKLKPKAFCEISVSCIGYKTKKLLLSVHSGDMGSIELEKEYKALDTVVVKADCITRRIACTTISCSRIIACGPDFTSVTRTTEEKSEMNSLMPGFAVFPNPSLRTATITIQLHQSIDGKIEILTAAGQLIQSTPFIKNAKISIPLKLASAGIYFVRVTETKTQHSSTQKLVIQ